MPMFEWLMKSAPAAPEPVHETLRRSLRLLQDETPASTERAIAGIAAAVAAEAQARRSMVKPLRRLVALDLATVPAPYHPLLEHLKRQAEVLLRGIPDPVATTTTPTK